MPSVAASPPAGGPAGPSRGSEDRRDDILRAGLDLFALDGFHGTSVRQIARAVGVNEATLYHYFPSKDAILQAVFDRVLADRRAAFTAWSQGDSDRDTVADILRRLGRVFLAHAVTPLELKLTRLMLSEGPRLSDEGRRSFERMHHVSMQPAIDLFVQLMADGKVRRLDAERAVMTFFAPMILWKICHAMGKQGGDADEGDRLLDHQVEMIALSLRP